jgi:hypothetical protein
MVVKKAGDLPLHGARQFAQFGRFRSKLLGGKHGAKPFRPGVLSLQAPSADFR